MSVGQVAIWCWVAIAVAFVVTGTRTMVALFVRRKARKRLDEIVARLTTERQLIDIARQVIDLDVCPACRECIVRVFVVSADGHRHCGCLTRQSKGLSFGRRW